MEYITTPEAAEFNAAARMRELGYPDARVTGRGADGGVDVVSDRAVAQVKQESYQTGRPALQRLYGARGEDRSRDLLFFSAAGYSRQAVAYADTVGIALFTYDVLGRIAAANPVGRLVEELAPEYPRKIVTAVATPSPSKKDVRPSPPAAGLSPLSALLVAVLLVEIAVLIAWYGSGWGAVLGVVLAGAAALFWAAAGYGTHLQWKAATPRVRRKPLGGPKILIGIYLSLWLTGGGWVFVAEDGMRPYGVVMFTLVVMFVWTVLCDIRERRYRTNVTASRQALEKRI
ncbi:restriction endonuclease [Rhodococcus opacus]|uniref:restriction endonuclease n=1 Tax=Rhodococcus opacus TaxID=37919 RepID=UPI001F55DCC4|nr:restriction endonuclease [Rhodococcus opacus]UNN05008.1 restriction endonuclease [Rhodococcus opacus]